MRRSEIGNPNARHGGTKAGGPSSPGGEPRGFGETNQPLAIFDGTNPRNTILAKQFRAKIQMNSMQRPLRPGCLVDRFRSQSEQGQFPVPTDEFPVHAKKVPCSVACREFHPRHWNDFTIDVVKRRKGLENGRNFENSLLFSLLSGNRGSGPNRPPQIAASRAPADNLTPPPASLPPPRRRVRRPAPARAVRRGRPARNIPATA